LLELAGVGQLQAAAGQQCYAQNGTKLPHSQHFSAFGFYQAAIVLQTLLWVI
jgi:hypothetical protein